MPTSKNWPAKIAAAQRIKTVNLEGAVYERTPSVWARCPDCAVAAGQLHVVNCDQEKCPRCRGQFLSCLCKMDGEVESCSA